MKGQVNSLFVLLFFSRSRARRILKSCSGHTQPSTELPQEEQLAFGIGGHTFGVEFRKKAVYK